jgi:hypothetical protein
MLDAMKRSAIILLKRLGLSQMQIGEVVGRHRTTVATVTACRPSCDGSGGWRVRDRWSFDIERRLKSRGSCACGSWRAGTIPGAACGRLRL